VFSVEIDALLDFRYRIAYQSFCLHPMTALVSVRRMQLTLSRSQ